MKYTGSIEVDITVVKDNLPTGYSPTFEYALSYNREQAFASFAAFMSKVRIDLERVGEGVVVVLEAVIQVAAVISIFALFLGLLYIVALA